MRMPYETLVADSGYECVEFPRAVVAVSHVIKDKGSGVENDKVQNAFCDYCACAAVTIAIVCVFRK